MIIARETFTTEIELGSFPEGREIVIQTSADLGVAFWNPAAGAYGAATTVTNPGAILACPSVKAKLTTAGSASINISLLS